jgi:undecaprenyl-phosphate galactose phosphotransferase
VQQEAWQRLTALQIRLTKLVLLLGDVCAFVLAGALATVWVVSLGPSSSHSWLAQQDEQRYLAWCVVCTLGLLIFLVRFRHYSDRKPFWTELGEVLRVVVVLALLDISLQALARWNSSRLWWGMVWPLAAVCLTSMRGVVRWLLLRQMLWQRPTVIIGHGPNAHEAMAALHSESSLGIVVADMMDISSFGDMQRQQLNRWLDVPGMQFVLAMEHGQNEVRGDVLRFLSHAHAEDVCVIPAMRGVPLYGTDISYFFSHEVALLKLRNNLRYWPARLTKRVFDVLASCILLLVLAIPMAWLAWRIRQDGGHAIFAHKRIGRDGKTFNCLKFRTMHMDAERKLRELLAQDPALQEEWSREFKLRNDPRVTDVGQLLRRTSLDELPQLFNVIRGDMSLVGPRPVVQDELCRYGEDVDYFLMVRPGMTGLWQVSGRNDVGYDARVYLDTWYVKNWSLWYDIAILFKTIKVVFKREGAY